MASPNKQTDIYRPTVRHLHSTLVVHDVLYMWGGVIDELRYGVHDGEDKLKHTSHVDMFYLTNGLWKKKPTSGKPPLGVAGYSCTSINNRLCYFGGWCTHGPIEGVCDGYHNSINVLDTTTLHWQQLSPTTDDGAMRRAYGGMISFSCDNEDLTFIIGGRGQVPKLRQPSASYQELPYCSTNECNIFNTTTSQWSVPIISGQCPPPCVDFTLNELPHNGGIMFGGRVGVGGVYYNDIYIIKLTKDTVHFTTLSKPDDPTIYWPKERCGHASTIITSDGHTVMAVIGGIHAYDSYIYNYHTSTWQQLVLPQSVSKISWHSLSVFTISHHCVLLVMFGGYYGARNDITIIIELVYTNNQWTPGDVLEDYDYTKVKEYLLILARHFSDTKDQLQQQSLAHQQQLLQLQQQLDTERRMRRSMALQLDKLQESSANILTGDVGTKEVTMTDIAIQCTTHDNTSEAIIQQLSDNNEVLKKELYKYQRSSENVAIAGSMATDHTQDYDGQIQQIQQQLKTEQEMKNNMAKEIDNLRMIQEENCDEIAKLQKQLKAEQEQSKDDIFGKKQRKDIEVQFSYLQPVSDNLREVTVVAEDLFTIAGDHPQVFHWEKYGFKMSVPQGSLEADETCDVAFKAIAHGQFQFPENTELVSGVYAIAMTRKLLRPATVEVEHCIRLKSTEQCNRLSFVKAYCTQKDLPYTFEPLKGGHFSPESSVGKISLSRFSQVAIVSSDGSDNDYLAHLLYYQICQEPPKWIVEFLATKSLQLASEHAKQKLEKLHNGIVVQECWRKTFEFQSEASYLTVKFPTIIDHNKWSIMPSMDTNKMTKKDVDSFSQESPYLPSCNATIVAGGSAEPIFHEKVAVEGTVEQLSFNITITLPPPPPPQVAPPTTSDSVTTQQQQVITASSTSSTYTVPSLEPVHQQALDNDTCKKLAHLLSQILRGHCADLNAFLKGATLQSFANKMCEAGIITVDLRDNPIYNEIEGQFTATLNISTTKDEFETCCKDFLDALKSQGKALERFAKKLGNEWKITCTTELQMTLDLKF